MKQFNFLQASQSTSLRALWLTVILMVFIENVFGVNKTASVSGNWDSKTTWGETDVPAPTDDVIINTGVNVTMNVDATCNSLTTGTISGTAAIDGTKTLTTNVLKISSGNNNNVIFSIGTGTTLVCTSIDKSDGGGNATVKLTVYGSLKNSGSTASLNAFTCNSGSTVEYNGGTQTVYTTTYNNLTLSGIGLKTFSATPTVNGILSLEETATISSAPTYGTAATLQYNTATARNVSDEWITPFAASGGVIIANRGKIILNGAKTFNANVPFTINNGATLFTNNNALILEGDFIGGPMDAGSSNILISGTATNQNIAGFSTTGTVSMNKISGIATLTGNVIGSGLVISESGTLNLGAGLIHKFKGTWTRTKGTLNGGSSTLILGGKSSGTGCTFDAGTGTVEYNGTAQTISSLAYNNLKLSVSGTNTAQGDITVNGTLTITSGGNLDMKTFQLLGTLLTITSNGTILTQNTTSLTPLPSGKTWGGTVKYDGANAQSISTGIYKDLITTGSGTKSIAARSAVTVNETLTTNGLLSINSDATNSGSLILGPNAFSSGSVTYNRWLNSSAAPATYSRWHITSAPVNVTSGFGVNAIKIHRDVNANNVYDFATYTESTNDWAYVATIPTTLNAGKGYLISLLPATDGMIQFTGTLNNGDIKPSVTSNPNNSWNAIGNPYTSSIGITSSAISAENFLTINSSLLNSSYAAIYVWNETASYDETQQYYKVIGNSGYVPTGGAVAQLSDNNIQAGQGFLINAKVNGNVTFTKAMQVHDTGLSLKSAEISWPGITLLAESHGQTRSTVVAFNEQMTTGLDVTYDAGLLASDAFQVYTHLVGGGNTVDFAIQCLPDNLYQKLSVPVGVDLPEGGELVFKASGIILPQGLYPVIEDRELQLKTPLKTETDTYMVTLARNTTGTGRFYLSVDGIALGKQEVTLEKKYTASLVNNRMVVNGPVEHGTEALLFDISGRKVGQYPLDNTNHHEIAVSGLSQRVYLLRIQGGNYSQVIKLVAIK